MSTPEEEEEVYKFQDLSKDDQLVFMAYKLGLPIELKSPHWSKWLSWNADSVYTNDPTKKFAITLHIMSLRLYKFRIKIDV